MGPADTFIDPGRAKADSAKRPDPRHEVSMDGYLVFRRLDIDDPGQVRAGHARGDGWGTKTNSTGTQDSHSCISPCWKIPSSLDFGGIPVRPGGEARFPRSVRGDTGLRDIGSCCGAGPPPRCEAGEEDRWLVSRSSEAFQESRASPLLRWIGPWTVSNAWVRKVVDVGLSAINACLRRVDQNIA